jgi:hypothetical protein
VHLQFTDPTLLIAVLAFLISLITMAILERPGHRLQP